MDFMNHKDLQLHHRSKGNFFLPGNGRVRKEMPGFGIFQRSVCAGDELWDVGRPYGGVF